eukprot:2880886-Alexandrium_andersonii.AAC.1
MRFHSSALGVVEGARGLTLQREGCCSAPVWGVFWGDLAAGSRVAESHASPAPLALGSRLFA